jgi:predicted SPOUT superfamily RNA methylase MTH1
METPQYLRRYLFRLSSGLRYVGILPPLRTTHHPTSRHALDLRVGDLRDGVVVGGRGAEVDIGVGVPARLTGRQEKLGERVTVRVVETGRAPRAVIVDRREIGVYWGYRVEASKLPLGAFIRRRDFDLVVATSKHGQSLADVVSSLRERWRSARRKIVVFGSPNEGLREILSHENLKLEDVADFTVNTVPGQGTETVRTEEAVYISLAGLLSVIGEKVGS